MSRLLLVLFAAVSIFAAETVGDCPVNEVWKECGTLCPPTCANPNPGICPQICVQGCQCVNGLLRNNEGVCVPEEDCDNK